MQEYVVNRPDEGAMDQILDENFDNAAGTILRLAWQAGLLRDEIHRLTWAQVDFLDEKLVLPDREVPIPPELVTWLAELRDRRVRRAETVVLSDRDQKPLTPQSISRLARTALDKGGQRAVRLIDLRHDFVLRQLEERDWQVVSRMTGIEAAALNAHFARYLKDKKVSTRIRRAESASIDDFALWKLFQAEGSTPAGVALWLTWQLGLRLEEIAALTWSQVDFAASALRLPGREVPLTAGTAGGGSLFKRECPPAFPRGKAAHPPPPARGRENAGRIVVPSLHGDPLHEKYNKTEKMYYWDMKAVVDGAETVITFASELPAEEAIHTPDLQKRDEFTEGLYKVSYDGDYASEAELLIPLISRL